MARLQAEHRIFHSHALRTRAKAIARGLCERLLQEGYNWKAIKWALCHLSLPVLVYQMGKVASSTVADSLVRTGRFPVFQIHSLNPDNIDQMLNERRAKGWCLPQVGDLNSNFFDRFIKPGYSVKIITLVREPISRNISAYFQNLDVIWQTTNAHEKIGLDGLIKGFLDRYPHSEPLTWFDKEFRIVLGIDIYEYKFDHNLNYLQIKKDPYEILVLKCDMDDAMKENIIEKFLGLKDFSLVPQNISAQKSYSVVYQNFVNEIRLPKSYIDQMLDSKYAQHFFSPEEVYNLRHKWLRAQKYASYSGQN